MKTFAQSGPNWAKREQIEPPNGQAFRTFWGIRVKDIGDSGPRNCDTIGYDEIDGERVPAHPMAQKKNRRFVAETITQL